MNELDCGNQFGGLELNRFLKFELIPYSKWVVQVSESECVFVFLS